MKTLNLIEERLTRSDFFAVLISLIAAALIFLPLFTSAKGSNTEGTAQVYMYSLNGSRAAVTLTNVSEGKYTISIESQNGENVYYNANIDSPEKFAKVFDFSRLEDGEYTVIVNLKNEVKEKQFAIKNGEIKVTNKITESPVFQSNDTKAMVELANANNQKVNIKIYSPEGKELYSVVEGKYIRKFFDFKNVEKGKYTVLVSTDENSFQFDFIKE
jgi:hypothetical protein